MSQCRSFRFRVYPTVKQAIALERALGLQCELYNAALEERRGAWRWERRSVNYVRQCRTLTELREVRPEVLEFGVTMSRGTLTRLDRAFNDFFKRCKCGEKPGYPRFKARSRFDSLQWEDTKGWKLKLHERRLYLYGIGDVKVNLHREVWGTPKAITVKREGRRWFVSIRCVGVEPTPLAPTGREVGVDLGVVNLVATSDGELVDGPRFGRNAAASLALAQRDLKLKRKGSNRRRRAVERVAEHHRRVRNQRRDLAHKVSRQLVNDYDLIVLEDLQVASMVRRPKPRPCRDGTFEPNGAAAKAGLNRSIHDAGWGELARMLAYKAEDAGRELRVVAPQFTSQRCSKCEHTDEASRRSQAVFRCTACGYEAHADINAARNVLWAGRA
ncbi:MAG TPA: transposase [Acidimicrobiales bacterium]|nr:transposase [Acidimicrobiales bacterium]